MKPSAFLDQVEHERVHQAIQAAEAGASARLVVYISHRKVGDPMATARRTFRKLHLQSYGHRAGLLLFVAPKSRRFAVLGGVALHKELGQEWWNHLAGLIRGHFKEERYTAGLLAAIREAGDAFHKYFPSEQEQPHPGERDIYDT